LHQAANRCEAVLFLVFGSALPGAEKNFISRTGSTSAYSARP
jgi:hypothetical protein